MARLEQPITPFWIDGESAVGSGVIAVVNPYNGRVVAQVSVPTDTQIERAVASAYQVRVEAAAMPAHRRAAALDQVSRRLAERLEEVAQLITAENGKPIRWARAEATRAVSTFRWAAEEARRWSGELQRLDTDPAADGRLAVTRRFPRGPVLGIAPFNFPLNLVAHKVAPALAVGAPIVIKPAPATPLSSLLLGELLAETDLPAGMVSVLPVDNDRMGPLVADPRLSVVSFTGSVPVGWSIKDAVPRKHVTLELGGNAAVVVCADYTADADMAWAASRIATFANYQAGQSCISVQRVLIHRELYDRLVPMVVAGVNQQITGDPASDATEVGPLISQEAVARVEAWVAEAVSAGGRVLTGGHRDGPSYTPTVLANVPTDAKVCSEEVFGPVLVVAPFDDFSEAIAAVNASRFGLQTGVFTRDTGVAFRAHRDLEVGGVIIGDVPSYRADQMPYGGVKDSGEGREGVRSAMEDFSYPRVMVLTGLVL
jgi:acyl-CoA reductase-like NAD-dependent aldehyde dehydrogenase